MRQRPLLIVLTGAFAFIVLSSNDTGPFSKNGENRTGAAGSTASCDGQDCHASNNATTKPTITITEGSSSTPATSYISGKTYTLHIGGTSSATDMTHFGFQLAVVRSANTSTQAGSLTAGTSTSVQSAPGGLKILEHTSPIAGTGSGNSWTYATTATWTAPTFGTGAVKMYLTLNAVNNDGFASGDKPQHIEATFPESQVGVEKTSFGADMKVYPNPATTVLHIQAPNTENGLWNVNAYDMHGRNIYAQQINIVNGTMQHDVNTSMWDPGIYELQLAKDGSEKTIPVVIQ